MTVVQFYHLTSTPLERALPKLMEKAYGAGLRTLVVAESNERIAQLNQLLWTYNPDSFLPHGSDKEPHSEDQPILLSSDLNQAPNRPLLCVTHPFMPEKPHCFERIIDIFDGQNAQELELVRQRWISYKNNGFSVSYFKQSENGAWEQKTAA